MTASRLMVGIAASMRAVATGDTVAILYGSFAGQTGVVTSFTKGRYRIKWSTGVESSVYRGDIRLVAKEINV